MREKKRAIFLDRDGTINKEKGYLFRISDFEFIPGVIPALQKLQNAGYLLIILTNQSGIARGYYDIEKYEQLNKWMLEELRKNGVNINKTYYCPHHPDAVIPQLRKNCDCRKPKIGMFKQAVEDYDLDLSKCFAIGDKIRDCAICETTLCHGILIGTNEDEKVIEDVKNGRIKNVKYAVDFKGVLKMILKQDYCV